MSDLPSMIECLHAWSPIIHSIIQALNEWMHSLTESMMECLNAWSPIIHSIIEWVHAFIQSCDHAWMYEPRSFIHSWVHESIYELIHSFIRSIIIEWMDELHSMIHEWLNGLIHGPGGLTPQPTFKKEGDAHPTPHSQRKERECPKGPKGPIHRSGSINQWMNELHQFIHSWIHECIHELNH